MPVLVLEKTYVPDSGGPGRHRGGLGQRCRVRKLHDDGRTTLVSAYPEGVNNPINGLYGGKPGCEPYARVYDAEGNLVQDCGTGALISLEDASRIVEVQLAGGSGFGDPKERSRELILEDLAGGRITEDGAKRDYGLSLADLRRPQEAAE